MRNEDLDSPARELAESAWLLDLARALVGRERAEDLVQEAWLERLRLNEEARHPRAFMATLMRRLAGRSARAERRREEREAEAERRRALVAGEAAERGRRLALLWREVEELDDDERSLVVLRYVDGLEPQMIARKLGISPNAARVRLHRALDELRHRLDRRHGGRREDWLRALSPLVVFAPGIGRDAAASSLGAGVVKTSLLMSLEAKVLIVAAAILLIAGAFILVETTREEEASLERAAVERAGPVAAARDDLPRRNPTAAAAVESRPAEEIDVEALAARALGAALGGVLREIVAGPRLVAGRVVDEGRRPVAGATVEWRLPHGGSSSTSSDAEGRFWLPPGEAAASGTVREGILLATDAAGRTTSRRLVIDEQVAADRSDVLLVLEQPARLAILCRDEQGEPVAGARVELRRPEEAASLVAKTAADGRLAVAAPGGAWLVVAADATRSGAKQVVVEAGEEREIDLLLAGPAAFDVLVTNRDGEPIADAELLLLLDPGEVGDGRVLRADLPRTDEQGRARVEGAGPLDGLAIGARAAGHHPSETSPITELLHDGRVTIALTKRAPALSWRLEDGEVARPADGETMVIGPERQGLEEAGVEDLPLPAGALGAIPGLALRSGPRARIAEGRLVVTGEPEEGAYIVTTPRGELARIRCGPGPSERGTISFRRPRSLAVRLEEDGRPCVGVGVQIVSAGGDPLRPTARSDDEGRVVFAGFPGGRFDLLVGPPGAMRERATRAASVDLDAGSQEILITLGRKLRATVDVRLGERPGLPARYELDLDGAQILAVAEDPDRGRLVIDYRLLREGTEHGLAMSAEGWLGASCTIPALPEARGRLVLARAASLEAEVRPPADGRLAIALLRRDEERGDWDALDEVAPRELADGSLVFRFRDLGSGRYRLVDRLSGLASAEVALARGESGAGLVLDLEHVETLDGRIVAPAGTDLARARVTTEGAAIDERDAWRLFGTPVADDGSFRLRIDRRAAFAVTARHPLLLATRVSSTALPARGSPLLIELAPGPRISGLLPEDIDALARLFVFPAGRRDRRVACHSLLDAGGRLELASLPPGRYDLVFDCAPYAQRELNGVEVGREDLDLGRIELGVGEEILIEMQLPEGSEIPDLHAAAWRRDEIGSVRFVNARGENPVRLGGLAPGRYRIEIGSSLLPGDERSLELEVRAGETRTILYP